MINPTNNAMPTLGQLALSSSIGYIEKSLLEKEANHDELVSTTERSHPMFRDGVNITCKSVWDSLKDQELQIFGSNHIMENIEKSVIKDWCKEFKILRTDLTFDERTALLTNNITILFKRLAKKFDASIDFVNLYKIKEKLEEKALIELWNKGIFPKLVEDPSKNDNETEAREIRFYITKSPAISPINNITTLALNFNKIMFIPPEITNFLFLKNLFLDESDIKCIPDFIGNLINLECLSLRSNDIHCIPNAISSCQKLKTLYLADNEITNIPDEMIGLNELECLTLGKNKITSIPGFLLSLMKLKRLTLSDNPIFLFSKNELDSIKSVDELKAFLLKAKELNEYQCTGRVSHFVQQVIHAYSIDRPDIVKKEFKLLNVQDKQLIREYFQEELFPFEEKPFNPNEDWDLKDEHLFENLSSLCKATLSAIVLKFERLSEDQQELVYAKLKGQEDPSYNKLMLSDIMEELHKFTGEDGCIGVWRGLSKSLKKSFNLLCP